MKRFPLQAVAYVLFSCSVIAQGDQGFVSLFNGKSLDGWASARSEGEGDYGEFSVNEAENAIHVYADCEAGSKQGTDVLYTENQYSHFVLQLEYKWLEKRFAPRTDWDRDSGLLFHIHGNLKKVWPLSLEMQIGDSPADKPHGKKSEGRFRTGDLFVLGRHLLADTSNEDGAYKADAEKSEGRHVFTKLGSEKPHGEWNQIEIRVQGSEKATFILNGDVVLETYDFTQRKKKDGEVTPLANGHIGLQAEWAELLFRNIKIKELPKPE